jgi:hypothetical protein
MTFDQMDAFDYLVLEGLPFADGSLLEVLEVLEVDQTRQPGKRTESWRALMRHVLGLPQTIGLSDEDITAEIDAWRRVSALGTEQQNPREVPIS